MTNTPTQLKDEALEKLNGNWGEVVLASFVYSIITGVISVIPFLGSIASIVLGGAFTLGFAIYFLHFTRNNTKDINLIFSGFKNFGNALGAYVLCVLIIIFGFIFLIVPGIIAALALSQTFRIMYDNPQLSITECMSRSHEMMKGHRGDYFILILSFIGWALLLPFTLFIGVFWLIPYVQTTCTIFYNKLAKHDPFADFAKDVN